MVIMKLTKEECKEALRGLEIREREENFKKWNQVAPLIKCDILEQLINEHFENSADFNHFKLYADSTLKTFKKDELIDYIHILYQNWQGSDWAYNNVVKANFQLLDEINELKSNQPLKFKELKEEMWVWDKKEYQYLFIVRTYDDWFESGNKALNVWSINGSYDKPKL